MTPTTTEQTSALSVARGWVADARAIRLSEVVRRRRVELLYLGVTLAFALVVAVVGFVVLFA